MYCIYIHIQLLKSAVFVYIFTYIFVKNYTLQKKKKKSLKYLSSYIITNIGHSYFWLISQVALRKKISN